MGSKIQNAKKKLLVAASFHVSFGGKRLSLDYVYHKYSHFVCLDKHRIKNVEGHK